MLIFYKSLEVKKRCDECAERAAAAMKFYKDNGWTDDFLVDLLVDLMHLAHREGMGFQEMLSLAEMHFTAEVNNELVEVGAEAPDAGS